MATHLRTWGTYWFGSNTANWNEWFDAYGKIKVYLESQSQANNASQIRIDHYAVIRGGDLERGIGVGLIKSTYRANNGSYGGEYKTVPAFGDGFSDSFPFQATEKEVFIGSTYHTIYHNPDGSAKLYVNGNISGRVIEYWDNNIISATRTSSFNMDIPTIPRFAKITSFTAVKNGFDKINVTWSSDVACDAVQYRLNGGSWVGASGNSFTISGLNPGTQYSTQIRVRRADSQQWTSSGTINVTTTDKNRMTSSITSVTCDDSLRVTASSASGEQCDIYIELLNADKSARIGEPIRHENTLDTTFTVEEIQSLANYLPNSEIANFRINVITVVDGIDKYLDYKDGTYTIINANPIFNKFTYEDIKSKTVNLTGDNQSVVKGYSDIVVTIKPQNKAIAQKGASIVGYRLVIGEKQDPETGLIPYSETENIYLSLDAVDNNVFTVYAIDSRGNSTAKQISPSTYIAYTDLTIGNANVQRSEGGVGSDVTLNANGSFFNANFGAVQNSVKSIKYKYKRTDITENWIEITDFTFFNVDEYKITFNNDTGEPDDNFYTYFKVGDKIKLVDTNGQNEIIANVAYMDYLYLVVDREITANHLRVFYEELWNEGTTVIPVTENGTSYSIESLIAGDLGAVGFNPEYSYDIILTIADELSSRSYSLLLGTGTPSYAVHADGMSINAPFDETIGKSFQVAGNKIMFNGLTLFEWVDDE